MAFDLSPDEPVEPTAHPMVDATINQWWGKQPMAAQATRTFARAMLREGKNPQQVARIIATHGITIE